MKPLAHGLIFYWISWILWIIVTFLMKRGKMRIYFATWILLAIGISNIQITIDKYVVSLLVLILLVGSIILFKPFFNKVIYLYIPFTVMVGFTAILLLEQGIPIWFFLPTQLFIPLICTLIIMFLVRNIYRQLISGILGIVSGEVVYSLILSGYGFQKTIGDPVFFDHILITIFLIICFHTIRKGRKKVIALVPNV